MYALRGIAEAPATVIDVGAHIGGFCLLARELWSATRVVACEADPENFELLERHTRSRAIEAVQAAIVGDDVREVEFNCVVDKVTGNSGGGSCVRIEPGSRKRRVPALSIVKLWNLKTIASCDLLKLDCEGSEMSILRALAVAGLLPTIRRIVGEWHTDNSERETAKGLEGEFRKILGATHDLVFRVRGGREGEFSAQLRSGSRR